MPEALELWAPWEGQAERGVRGGCPGCAWAVTLGALTSSLLQMYRLTLRTSKETVSQRLCALLSEQF